MTTLMKERSIGMCITLRPSEQNTLRAMAQQRGQTVSGFIRSIIEQEKGHAAEEHQGQQPGQQQPAVHP